MAENHQTQIDVASGVVDRAKTTYTAIDSHTLTGDDYALADEGGVIINTRTRIAEAIACLERLGLIEAA
jgi:hypothetical protein